MGEEKRFIVFLVLTMIVVVATPPLFQWITGPVKQPAAAGAGGPQQDDANQDDAKPDVADAPGAGDDRVPVPEAPVAAAAAAPIPVDVEAEPDVEERTLGSLDPGTGYRMFVHITNRDAAVNRIELGEFENEKRTGPLEILTTTESSDDSFLLTIKGHEAALDHRNWKILDNDPDAPTGRQTVRLQTALPELGIVITKEYSLETGSYNLGLFVEIKNTSGKSTSVSYRLGGPRGFVLEGAWYATKKRDAAIADGIGANLKRSTAVAPALVKGAKKYFDMMDARGAIPRDKWPPLPPEWFDRFDRNGDGQLTGDEVDEAACHLASTERYMERPVRFAGVDGQFFCAIIVLPTPPSPAERYDAVTSPVLRLTEDELLQLKRRGKLEHPDRCDVSVEIESQTFEVPAGESLSHNYTVYAGPRKRATIEESLGDPAIAAAVMNYQGALFNMFPPALVSFTATTMVYVLNFFHKLVHNWGVAIIMLTVLVRLLMFPLSRKQALAAVKMQALKPELDALKEKYKNDKEKLSRAQMELWRKHNVNPLGGCLPLLIQMPIFIGLWQGLQSWFDLRQARFLWIDNLAAPDGPSVPFFHWGENIPLLSWAFGPYFNLLPAILIGLFLIQQKMFMPPKSASADPQVEMQQKMMTYMMVFFGYIFWRLPSGLCLYYIASTLWGISERKLLPKLTSASNTTVEAEKEKKTTDGSDGRKSKTTERDGKANGRDGRDRKNSSRRVPTLVARLQELLKKADKR